MTFVNIIIFAELWGPVSIVRVGAVWRCCVADVHDSGHQHSIRHQQNNGLLHKSLPQQRLGERPAHRNTRKREIIIFIVHIKFIDISKK